MHALHALQIMRTFNSFYEYSSMLSDSKHKATKGKGWKILTSKKILQRLPIALARVKADNNSEQ